MKRVMIIGQPGSGKSTLARLLGDRTGLPVVHIDQLHWQAGWVERSKAETSRLCQRAEEQSQWFIEGGHSATWLTRLARADMLIVLDRPVVLRLRRVLLRSAVVNFDPAAITLGILGFMLAIVAHLLSERRQCVLSWMLFSDAYHEHA